MLSTWQNADCSKQEPYNGDFKAAMQAIKAKMLVLPGQTDLYFPWVKVLVDKDDLLTYLSPVPRTQKLKLRI
jgi:hypothetical protein